MKSQNQFHSHIDFRSLALPALLGSILPLALLLFLIISSGDSFALWMAVPLTLIPASGAFGGVFFYLMGFRWFPRGSQKLIAVIFSILVYFVILWLSAVLAFNFTGYWD